MDSIMVLIHSRVKCRSFVDLEMKETIKFHYGICAAYVWECYACLHNCELCLVIIRENKLIELSWINDLPTRPFRGCVRQCCWFLEHSRSIQTPASFTSFGSLQKNPDQQKHFPEITKFRTFREIQMIFVALLYFALPVLFPSLSHKQFSTWKIRFEGGGETNKKKAIKRKRKSLVG